MRMFLKVLMDVDAANRAIKDGTLPKVVEGFANAVKPDGMWFIAEGGKRCMVAVFDMVSTAQIPSLAEPFFEAVGAAIELTPAMDAADLKAGLSGL
jgi:hypothetical protein